MNAFVNCAELAGKVVLTLLVAQQVAYAGRGKPNTVCLSAKSTTSDLPPYLSRVRSGIGGKPWTAVPPIFNLGREVHIMMNSGSRRAMFLKDSEGIDNSFMELRPYGKTGMRPRVKDRYFADVKFQPCTTIEEYKKILGEDMSTTCYLEYDATWMDPWTLRVYITPRFDKSTQGEGNGRLKLLPRFNTIVFKVTDEC